MTVNEMKHLRLDTELYADIMAQTLAIIHWKEVNFQQRSDGIWDLDFDQCKLLTEDANSIKQLECGFYFNDSYYPRPTNKNRKDVVLWDIFKESSADHKCCALPGDMSL